MIKYASGYPLVDLFAGPGGLGEGFAGLYNDHNSPAFKPVTSIEMDKHSHQTLLLRHFFHSFRPGQAPDSYYKYLANRITKRDLIHQHKKQWEKAENSAVRISLERKNHNFIKSVIAKRLRGKKKWVLTGGPPCQAYSLVGRSRMTRSPEFSKDERRFLYKEYLKILIDHKPPVFIMENVKGLLSAKINGRSMVDQIFRDLSSPTKAMKGNARDLNYNLFSLVDSKVINGTIDPGAFIVEAEKYGVPQSRHRIFILGVRSDLKIHPSSLQKKNPPALEQIIGGMPKIRSRVSRQKDSDDLWKNILTAANNTDWIKNHDKKNSAVKNRIKSALEEIKNSSLKTSATSYKPPESMKSWYYDERLSICTAHETRSHMESDLHRYLFVSSYGAVFNLSPTLADFPVDLLPAHKNIAVGRAGRMFSDRFRVQLKAKISATVTSHIAKDGHYFIHYDPAQCRSLTVREAARIQTFPDNYFFEGPRTDQYNQIGNAVPPYLAAQIAEIVKEILDKMPEDE